MSDIPDEAVEAALPTYRLMHPCGNEPVPGHCAGCYYDLSKILAAAAPIIRADERRRVAEELRVEMRRHDNAQVGFSAVGDAYSHAARIAEEGGQVGCDCAAHTGQTPTP